MRSGTVVGLSAVLTALVLGAALASYPGPATGDPERPAVISDTTWVDHDGQPIPRPPDWEPDFYGHLFHDAIAEPLSHAFDVPDKLLALADALGAHSKREAVNVNAFDEVPNSTWFTNRNHVRAVPVSQLLLGPDSTLLPEKPWTIKHPKKGGTTPGFEIKDAAGRKWLVKLDWVGYPQLSSGADMIARTLLHAAGYNVPHNEPVRFRREDLVIDPRLLRPGKGERLTEANLDSMLARGAVTEQGEYWATSSLFLPGHALGSLSMSRRRPGDLNDWYSHTGRRELRGLYVVSSWLNFWDTKDANFLDMFDSTGTGAGRGYVKHYILDPGSSLGATADGKKRLQDGYEAAIDLGWNARRFLTLGFAVEPWRRAHQETDVPSVGRLESSVFRPDKFAPGVPDPAFREMTDRDAYWGAKIVASFSDAQIRAAVDAAHYEDPRAPPILVQNLIERRNKIARYWFGKVAPLDFFEVRGGALHFHDLAVDMGLNAARHYSACIEFGRGQRRIVPLASPDLALQGLEGSAAFSIELSVDGDRAKPAHVDIARRGAEWVVTGVRHG